MDRLDPKQKDRHDGTELVAKKKLESKFLGAGRKPFKNARLWALDIDNANIYEVNLVSKKSHKVSGLGSKATIESAKHTVHVNPDHQLVWASNRKNAVKKFMKIKIKV